MTAIIQQNFIGERPLVRPRFLPENAATIASNCRLDDGGLTPFRQSVVETSDFAADATGWQTLYKWGSTWVGWDDVVNAAPGPVATDRLYFTGDSAAGKPQMRVGVTDYALGIEKPAAAVTLSKAGTGSGNVYTRLYVYTWVTDFGEESAPCPASDEITWQDGETITLDNFEDVSATQPGRNITKQRIYRSQTGQLGTFFYLIAERTASASTFDDTVPIDGFQEILPSTYYTPPPDTLAGLTSLPNGMMAGFDGKRLYFCEPYQPHAWPEPYARSTAYTIVALVSLGDSLIVLTDGQPYIAQGTSPESMVLKKLEFNLPCVNARSVVDLGYAACYASNDGLVLIDANGQPRLVTGSLFNSKGWKSYNPETMIGCQLYGRYFAFFERTLSTGQLDKGALIIDTSGDGFLIRTDTRANAVVFDLQTSKLYFVSPTTGAIMQFDATNASRRTLNWRSKEHTLPTPINFAAILIDGQGTLSDEEVAAYAAELAAIVAANQAALADDIEDTFNGSLVNEYVINGSSLTPIPSQTLNELVVTIYADGELMQTITQSGVIKRLKGKKTARVWEIEVSTNITIERIAMATTTDELRAIM